MTVRPVWTLADPASWRQVGLTGLGAPVGLAGAGALALVVAPPVVLFFGRVQIETRSGPVDPGSPPMVALWTLAVLLGLALALAVASADRLVVARLVPARLAAGWPRLGWRRYFGTDAVWRRLAWLALRSGLGVVTVVWGWFVGSTVVRLLSGSVPIGTGTAWRPLLAAGLVLATLHAARGIGWLLTLLAHDLLGPSPRDRIAELDQRAGLLEQRARLARELHDSVGHSVTVVLLQAASARAVLERDPRYAADALAAIERAGRAAMGELGRALDLLRTDDPGASIEAPGLDELDSLLAGARAAGLPVTATVDGDVAAVPPRVGAMAYRIVQEGCTNVLRHAGAARTEVAIRIATGAVRVEVANEPGPAGTGMDPPIGSGQGLDGLAARVEALGGRLRGEPRPDGGFRLAAWLPLET